jgi:hypothetical protein
VVETIGPDGVAAGYPMMLPQRRRLMMMMMMMQSGGNPNSFGA